MDEGLKFVNWIAGEMGGSLQHVEQEKGFNDDQLMREELEFMALKKPRVIGHIEKLVENLKRKKTAAVGKDYTVGLALSGGGIRSAIAALGVLQKLAKVGLLAEVDYLSTVSGGGFIGTAVSWWMNRVKAGKTGTDDYDLGKDFPFGIEPLEAVVDDKTHQSVNPMVDPPLLHRLRNNGKYLIPDKSHGVVSGIAVVTRAVFLSLFIWIPVVALAFMLLNWLGTLGFLVGLPVAVDNVAHGTMQFLNARVSSEDVSRVYPASYLFLLLSAFAVGILFVLVSVNMSILSWVERAEGKVQDGLKPEYKESSLPIALRWLIVLIPAGAIAVLMAVLALWEIPVFKSVFGAEVAEPTYFGKLVWPSLVLFAPAAMLYAHHKFQGTSEADNWQRGKFNLLVGAFAVIAIADLLLASWWFSYHPAFLATEVARWVWGAFFVAVATGFFWFLFYVLGYWIQHSLKGNISQRYGARRHFEKFFGTAFKVAAGCAAIGILPGIVRFIDSWLAGGPGAAISLILGVASAIWGHYRTYLRGLGGTGTAITLVIGSLLLLYGIMIGGYKIALIYEEGDALWRGGLLVVVASAVILGWFSNLNYLSLHRFYRDRLAEAFLPNHENIEQDGNTPATEADDELLGVEVDSDQNILPNTWPLNKGPYHIINANVILGNSQNAKFRVRGGDNFMLSPLYCGSNATGWRKTPHFAGGELSLASAMAVSGAAANPRSGFVGTGITRNGLVSLAMSLLSLRLGYWVTNPAFPKVPIIPDDPKVPKVPEQPETPVKVEIRRANHFFPSGVYAMPGFGYTEESQFLELSDGGHFENLGLYELVRRRCGLIIICDGGQDPDSSYQSLAYAVTRVKEDFGATIKFKVKEKGQTDDMPKFSDPSKLVAREKKDEFPKGAEFAERGYFLASVDYGNRGGGPWPQKGLIIYMKSAMIKELGLVARGYKGSHPEFPYQSTNDQFFHPEQFEAYREVGYKICQQMLYDTDLLKLFGDNAANRSRPDIGKLYSNDKFVVG